MRRTVLLAAALCVSLPALAQVRVCMGGDFDRMSAADRQSCENRVRLAATATLPADWHIVVVCGEEGWKDYTAFTGREAAALSNASADIDSATRTIFLRSTSITPASVAELVSSSTAHPTAGL